MFNCAAVKNGTDRLVGSKLWSETHRGRGTQVFKKTQCFYIVTVNCNVKLWSETHRGRGTQVFKKTQCFYIVTVNCNVSIYYRVT